eukprot:7556240-Alexandrium_andersonii.AAC.1
MRPSRVLELLSSDCDPRGLAADSRAEVPALPLQTPELGSRTSGLDAELPMWSFEQAKARAGNSGNPESGSSPQ